MIEIIPGVKHCISVIGENILYILSSLIVISLFATIHTAYKNICKLLVELVKTRLVHIDISMSTEELIDLAQQIWKI